VLGLCTRLTSDQHPARSTADDLAATGARPLTCMLCDVTVDTLIALFFLLFCAVRIRMPDRSVVAARGMVTFSSGVYCGQSHQCCKLQDMAIEIILQELSHQVDALAVS
jgi:hypothetical protein